MRLRYVLALLVVCLMVAGCDHSEAPKPAPSVAPSPVAASEPQAVTEEQQAAVEAALKRLYSAYQARDVQAVLDQIHEAVEKTARDYQASHPEKPGADEEIRVAFRAFHEDIFNHQDYRLEDFQFGFADFAARPDGSVEVVSSVPIIGTEAMTFEDSDGTPATVRLRLGRFVLRPVDGDWRIVEMDLF